MSIFYRAESLPALFGFEDDKDKLSAENTIRHAAVNTGDYSGVRHGVLCLLELDDKRLPSLKISHWTHFEDGENALEEEITISFKREIIDDTPHYAIEKLNIMGRDYIDANNPDLRISDDIERRIPAAIKAIYETVAVDDQIPDIPTIIQDYGIPLPRSGRRTMTGIRRGGLPFNPAHSKQANKGTPIFYRRTFLPALIGVETQANKVAPIDEQHDILSDPKTGKQYDMFYTYERDMDKPGNVDISCMLRVDQEKDPICLYHVKTAQSENDEKLTTIKELRFFDRPIDVTNEVVLTRALETIRMHNHAIARRHYSRGEGVLMREILHETGLIPHIYKRPEAPSIADGGRFRGRVLGGVNEGTAAISSKENSIGGNSYAASFDYKNASGENKSFSIIVDDGIGFLDYEKDGFDYWKASLDPFLKHMSDEKDFSPETETLALVYTHKHKDHFFWEAGYVPPVLIMEPLTYRQFCDDVKDMKELSKQQQEELINACHVVDPIADVNPDNPSKVTTRIYGDTIVEQWSEEFPDIDKSNGKDYAPRLRIYKKGEEEGAIELRLNYVSHSAPCMMVDIVTKAKTIGLTGDFKFTNDVYVGKPTSRAWIAAQERDFILMETTGADRKEKTPNYKELEDNYTAFFYNRASAGRRLILPIMPNDVQTLYCVANAMKRARAKILTDDAESELLSHFTADGKTLEDMVRYLNNGQSLFKKFMASEEYDKNGKLIKAGITYQGRTSKAITELATATKSQTRAQLAIAVTGTQTEDMSVMQRASEGELDRWEIGAFDTILNTKKGIPVGRNIQLRKAQKEHIESTYGAEYILPEEYESEHGLIMAVSGHGGKEDLEEMIRLSNAKYIGVTHGTNEKFKAVEKMIAQRGKTSIRLSHQEERGGSLKDNFNFIAQTEEYREFAREVYPRPFFWRKKWADKAVVKMRPELNGPIGKLVQQAERAAINSKKHAEEHRRRHIIANDNDRQHTGLQMPARLPKIGAEKESESFYKRNNIALIASADTEGTGLVEEKARLSQYAHHIRDIETRQEIDAINLKMQTPDHAIWSIFAALKTNTHPDSFKDGDTPRIFAHKVNSALTALKTSAPADEDKKSGKTLLMGFNFHRHDSILISKELGLSGQRDLFTHKSSGIYLFDVRHFARMVRAYAPDAIKVNSKVGKGNRSYQDFSLEGLCAANNIDYPRSHDGLEDTYPAYALYEYLENNLKAMGRDNILEQALINCDKHSDSMAKDIVGANLRPGAPKPVFSYVSHIASRGEPRLGVVVGTEITATSGRALIVFNLDHDPDKHLDADEDTLLEMAKNPYNDVFDVIYLDRHPILAPMDYAFASQADKSKIKFSKETYLARAGAISRNLTRSIEQNAVAENKTSKQAKIVPFETRVLNAFGRVLKGNYAGRSIKDRKYNNIDRYIYRIPQLKAEWGLIRRSSEDMKSYDIAPTEREIEEGVDHRHIAHMAVLLGQLNNEDLITLTEENLFDLWMPLSERDQTRVSRLISSQLRKTMSLSKDDRREIKLQIMGNLATALNNVRKRRALNLHAPASADHTSLKKAWAQYERMKSDKKLYNEYVENDPVKKAIFDAWPDYLKSIEDSPLYSAGIAHDKHKTAIKTIKQRFK